MVDKKVEQVGFDKFMKDIEFEEENKYRNWYTGLSYVGIRRHSLFNELNQHSLPNYITKATSGRIVTPFYLRPMKPSEFYLEADYSYNIENVLDKCSPNQILSLIIRFDIKETV